MSLYYMYYKHEQVTVVREFDSGVFLLFKLKCILQRSILRGDVSDSVME